MRMKKKRRGKNVWNLRKREAVRTAREKHENLYIYKVFCTLRTWVHALVKFPTESFFLLWTLSEYHRRLVSRSLWSQSDSPLKPQREKMMTKIDDNGRCWLAMMKLVSERQQLEGSYGTGRVQHDPCSCCCAITPYSQTLGNIATVVFFFFSIAIYARASKGLPPLEPRNSPLY